MTDAKSVDNTTVDITDEQMCEAVVNGLAYEPPKWHMHPAQIAFINRALTERLLPVFVSTYFSRSASVPYTFDTKPVIFRRFSTEKAPK